MVETTTVRSLLSSRQAATGSVAVVSTVETGCRSLMAVWEHITDLAGTDLRSLGLQERQALPSESTIRRVLQDLDPAGLDAHLASWLCTRTGIINGRWVVAVDG